MEKGINVQFYWNKESNNNPIESNTTNQLNNNLTVKHSQAPARVKVELLAASAKNRFLISLSNLCQVLIDVKYTRGWQVGLKKNLQDSAVNPVIYTTQKMKFPVKDLFNIVSKSAVIQICSYSLKIFLTKKFIFCAWICAINR